MTSLGHVMYMTRVLLCARPSNHVESVLYSDNRRIYTDNSFKKESPAYCLPLFCQTRITFGLLIIVLKEPLFLILSLELMFSFQYQLCTVESSLTRASTSVSKICATTPTYTSLLFFLPSC